MFSNAGYGVLGEVDSTKDEVARRCFETNLWGGMGVAREAVRVFRDVNGRDGGEKGGRLIVISTLLGILSGATLGCYVASKHYECFSRFMLASSVLILFHRRNPRRYRALR